MYLLPLCLLILLITNPLTFMDLSPNFRINLSNSLIVCNCSLPLRLVKLFKILSILFFYNFIFPSNKLKLSFISNIYNFNTSTQLIKLNNEKREIIFNKLSLLF